MRAEKSAKRTLNIILGNMTVRNNYLLDYIRSNFKKHDKLEAREKAQLLYLALEGILEQNRAQIAPEMEYLEKNYGTTKNLDKYRKDYPWKRFGAKELEKYLSYLKENKAILRSEWVPLPEPIKKAMMIESDFKGKPGPKR